MNICFLVNVDWFFESHRRHLADCLNNNFDIEVIAGDSGFKKTFETEKFSISGRIPTLKGLLQLYRLVNSKKRNTRFIVVSPVMIVFFHFFFPMRKIAYYNFSGLGFLRKLSIKSQKRIISIFKIYPTRGKRIIVVQNKDDYKLFQECLKNNSKYILKIIPGSGSFLPKEIETIPHDPMRIGYVGRISKDKGVLTLIKAINKLKKSKINIDLVIWGKLDERKRHGFSQKELDFIDKNQAYLCGTSNNKQEIFNSFDVFCLPSNGEGISKAAIEASSFSRPLLLSDVPGNRDMVDGNGFLFRHNDLADLSKKIIKIHQIGIVKFGEKSKSLFLLKWHMDLITNKWVNILNYDIARVK